MRVTVRVKVTVRVEETVQISERYHSQIQFFATGLRFRRS